MKIIFTAFVFVVGMVFAAAAVSESQVSTSATLKWGSYNNPVIIKGGDHLTITNLPTGTNPGNFLIIYSNKAKLTGSPPFMVVDQNNQANKGVGFVVSSAFARSFDCSFPAQSAGYRAYCDISLGVLVAKNNPCQNCNFYIMNPTEHEIQVMQVSN